MWPLAVKLAGPLWKAAQVAGLVGAGVGGTDYLTGLNKSRRDEYIQKGAGPDGTWTDDDFNLWDRHVLQMNPTWFDKNAEQYRQSLPIVQKYKKYKQPGLTADQSIETYKNLYEEDVADLIAIERQNKIHQANLTSPEYLLKKDQLDNQTKALSDKTNLLREQMLNQQINADKNRLQQMNILDTRSRNDALQWQKQMEYMDRKDYARDRSDRMKLLIAGLSQLGASFAA